MPNSFLGPKERQNLFSRIQGNPKTSLVPVGNGLTKFRQPLGFGITMVCRIMCCLAYTLNNMSRRWQIRVANTKIDYISPPGLKLGDLPIYFHEEIRRQPIKSSG